MAFPADIEQEHPGVGTWSILHAWRGSVAHGMYDPPDMPNSIDDKDTIAICVPPMDHYLGLSEFGSQGTQEIKRGEWDIVVYEARKAITMLSRGNPNVLSILWLPESRYIKRTPAGDLLLSRRDLFVGKWVYSSFIGYAKSQLHKMQHGAHQGYMGQRRRELVARYGYDCKNAAHLIRLLRMGVEFLNTGELTVDREGLDATELLDIKHGEWSLERVKDEAEQLFRRAENTYDRCTLPSNQDRERINRTCVEVVELSASGQTRSLAK